MVTFPLDTVAFVNVKLPTEVVVPPKVIVAFPSVAVLFAKYVFVIATPFHVADVIEPE